jgi:mono/diheme cytochrome c family protein
VWVVVAVTVVIGTLVGLGLAEEGPVPVERDQAAVAAGEEQFVASCAVCHGPDLLGSPTGPPLLVPTYAPNHHGDEAFQQAVAFGVPPHHWNFGPMAPIEGLSRDDVSQIVAYVRTMQEAEGIFIDPTH